MKLDRKGFTLIELLAVIVIVSLVFGFSVFGIIKAVNNSKDKATYLSVDSLKDAARIYSAEGSSYSWKKITDYDAFCVTVGELMNKGLLDKNGIISERNIDRDTYIIVKRNNVTMAIEKEEIAMVDDDNYKICTNTVSIPGESITKPKILFSSSYTDSLTIFFQAGSATYNGNDSVISYRCLYGDSSSNVNEEGIIDGNKCILNNLKNNSEYYVLVYMNTDHGTSVVAEGSTDYWTSDFNDSIISQDKNVVKITYSDKDSNGNDINNPSYYFKSTVSGTSSVNVTTCTMNSDNTLTCNESTDEIKEGVWYKSEDTVVDITYPEANNSVTINARVYDGSNNYKEKTDTFTIKKYTVKFYKNSALSIGGSTADYVEKYCIAGSSNACSITSPSIEAKTGYSAVGYNTNSSGMTSSWSASASKNVSSDATYYAIVKKVVTITFEKNGADSIGNTSLSCTMWNSDINCSIQAPTITKSGYSIIGWNTSSSATTSEWNVGTSKSFSSNKTYYAITKKNSYTITYNANGGSGAPSAQTATPGVATTLSTTVPTRKDSSTGAFYAFTGWSTSKTGGTIYAAGAKYTGSSNVTLYAQWHTHSWTVVGTTIRTLYSSTFTCGFNHTQGYYYYCETCGMSSLYYREKYGSGANYLCPCLHGKSLAFNDSSYTGNQVKGFGGLYFSGENKLSGNITSNTNTNCSEHYDIDILSLMGGSYTYSNYTFTSGIVHNMNNTHTTNSSNSNKDMFKFTIVNKTAIAGVYKGLNITFYRKNAAGAIIETLGTVTYCRGNVIGAGLSDTTTIAVDFELDYAHSFEVTKGLTSC